MSRRYGGIGLGLPLAQRLMEQHGGRLDIDSTPGVGTCVAAILPATRVCVETTADGPDARAG
jgi:signal transduction histidine kinase